MQDTMQTNASALQSEGVSIGDGQIHALHLEAQTGSTELPVGSAHLH